MGRITYTDLAAKLPPAWSSPAVLRALMELDYPKLTQSTWAPDLGYIFRALEFFSPQDCELVILGGSPYPQPGKSNGLAFGVRADYPKLKRYDSLSALLDEANSSSKDYTLESWAKQGVLLLNIYLTTVQNIPSSHQDIGWPKVTRALLDLLPVSTAYLLLGNEASRFVSERKVPPSLIVKSGHPSPLTKRAHNSFKKSQCFERIESLVPHIVW